MRIFSVYSVILDALYHKISSSVVVHIKARPYTWNVSSVRSCFKSEIS